MKGKTASEGRGLEADIQDLKQKLEQTDGEVAKLEIGLETASQVVATEHWAVRKGAGGAQERYSAAVGKAEKIKTELEALHLVRAGLAANLAALERRQRTVIEGREAQERERQRAEFTGFVEKTEADATDNVTGAIEAYEAAALALGAAVGSFETLCSKCGTEGHYQAGLLIERLLAGVQPAALEAKGFGVVRELPRPPSPHGALEFRLLPVRVGVLRESET